MEDPFGDEPRFSDEVLELEGEYVKGKFEELVGERLDEDGSCELPVELNEEVDTAEDGLVFEDAVLEIDILDELEELLLELPRELDLEEADSREEEDVAEGELDLEDEVLDVDDERLEGDENHAELINEEADGE